MQYSLSRKYEDLEKLYKKGKEKAARQIYKDKY